MKVRELKKVLIEDVVYTFYYNMSNESCEVHYIEMMPMAMNESLDEWEVDYITPTGEIFLKKM